MKPTNARLFACASMPCSRGAHSFHGGIFRLIAVAAVCLMAGSLSEAKNAAISNHITNLSESAASTAPGWAESNVEIRIEGQTVHTFWMSAHPDGGTQLSYRRSLDGGHTWQSPYTFYQQDLVLRDPNRDEDQQLMTVIDGTVHIAFGAYGGEGGGWFGRLVYLRSLDNGATFEAPRFLWSSNVPNPEPWHAYDVRVASAAGKVAIVARIQANWYDHLSAHVYLSSDYGTHFTDTVAASGGGGGGWTIDDFHFTGDTMALLYNQSYYYYGLNWSDLYVSASDDGGATFHQQRISVPSSNGNHKTLWTHDYHYSPKIFCHEDRIHVVWLGIDASDSQAVFHRRSMDGGRTWEEATHLTAGTVIPADTLHSQHTLAVDDDRVFVLIPTTSAKMFLRTSVDGGQTFGAPVEVTDSAGDSIAASTWWPVMKRVPSGVSGVTALDIVGNDMKRFRSLDDGATFTASVIGPVWSYRGVEMAQFVGDAQGNTHIISKATWTWYSTGVFGDRDTLYARMDQQPAASSGTQALQMVTKRNAGDGTGEERWDGMLAPDDGTLIRRDAMTVEFWVKVPSLPADTETYYWEKQGPGAGGAWETILIGNWRSGQADARIATETDGYVLVGADSIVDGAWHHVAVTYDAEQEGENFFLYVDGEQVAATTASGLLKAGRGPVILGGDNNQRAEGTVVIDDVRTWDGALDVDTIRSRMSQTLTGTEDGLLSWYPLDGSARDASGHAHHGRLLYRESFVAGMALPISSLAQLVLSHGELTPAFAPGTTVYTASVDASLTHITVTPTVMDAASTVEVNGTAVSSGVASAPIPLAIGETVLSVKVTAADASTTTYTVTVTRQGAGEAMLTNLVFSKGQLDPSFNPAITNYAMAVPNGVASLKVTPTAADLDARVMVNGTLVSSGSASAPLPLAVGDNKVRVVVTTEDGTMKMTYLVIVTRAPSSVSTLSGLKLDIGSLKPDFDKKTTEYVVKVAYSVRQILITPQPSNQSATVRVNDELLPEAGAGIEIPLKVGKTPIELKVTAQNGKAVTTYQLTVIRAARPTAKLKDLVVKGLKLSPKFKPAMKSYQVTFPVGQSALRVKAIAADPKARITINGIKAKSGRFTKPIHLSPGGTTKIIIRVKARDGVKLAYQIKATGPAK